MVHTEYDAWGMYGMGSVGSVMDGVTYLYLCGSPLTFLDNGNAK